MTRCLSMATDERIRFVEARRAAHRTPTVVSPISRMMSMSSTFTSVSSMRASNATPAICSSLVILVWPFFLRCGSPEEIPSFAF